jgi:hypothetical protein
MGRILENILKADLSSSIVRRVAPRDSNLGRGTKRAICILIKL